MADHVIVAAARLIACLRIGCRPIPMFAWSHSNRSRTTSVRCCDCPRALQNCSVATGIVDTSVFRAIPAGNTAAPTMALAGLAAELIAEAFATAD